LLALLANLAINKVTSLEPRTPHQPEKLKKLSKNEYLFTPSMVFVNEKSRAATTRVFNRVQPVHKPVTGFGADRTRPSHPNPRQTRLCTLPVHCTPY